jgi:hypothetical protein
MNTCIYDKTDQGREEIATRKYQLPPKLRTLLVMIDGRHTLESLLKNFAVLGLSKDNVDELARQGFIALVAGGEETEEAPTDARPARPPASARARMLARTAKRQETLLGQGQREAAPAEPVKAPPVPARRALSDYFNLASDSVNFSES